MPTILHSKGFLSFPMRFLIHSIFLYYTSWIYYPFSFLLLSWVCVLIPLLLHYHLKSVCIAKAIPFIPSCYRRTLCHFFDCLDIVYLIIQKLRFIFLSQMNHYLFHIVQMCITSNLKSFCLLHFTKSVADTLLGSQEILYCLIFELYFFYLGNFINLDCDIKNQ